MKANESATVQLQTTEVAATKKTRTRVVGKATKAAPVVVEATLAMRELRYPANPYQSFADYGKGFFRSYTIAAFVAAGLAKFGKEAITQTKGGAATTLRALIGQTAFNHWKSTGRFEVADGVAHLTAGGMNEISASLSGTNKHPASIATATALYDAMQGATASVEVEGRKVVMGQTIKVRA